MMQDTLPTGSNRDLERNDTNDFLMNNIVHDFTWSGLTVSVKDRQTKQPRNLIEDISGNVQQGKPLLQLSDLLN